VRDQASAATPGPAGVVPAGLMRVDLHCHSEASADCRTPLAAFPVRCARRGISVQAITDHNEVWGAQKLRALAAGTGLTVIVGEEVSTRDGEIVGLFLESKIEAGLSAEETIERIRAQGGLVLLPHGFDPLKRARLTPQALERVGRGIDIVEAFNARISRPTYNRAAAAWADAHGLPKSAGSDAHIERDIGDAWVQTPTRDIDGPAALLEALRAGTVMGEWTHPVFAFAEKMVDLARRRLGGK
jgi:predicted metal-dependent phosphoesterase TrpH